VIVPDQPWERRATYLYGTVLFDEQDQLFKAWYQTFWMDPPVAYMCYAVSRDGVTWEKPSLGFVECEGSKANNIVLAAECGTVVKDAADADPSRRYKMLAFRRPHYDVFFSADGITWRPGKQDAIREGDVANVTYDPRGKRFVAMTKQPHKPGRAAFVSYSEDFETWTKPKLVFEADACDQADAKSRGADKMEVYGMPAVDYHGVQLGFPWMFRITGKGGKNTGGDGFIDLGLATSRDW
jgi:hypothetical protein